MYLGSALGDVAASDFVNRNGVCKPTNFATLAKFKALQSQLNRIAEVKGLKKIGVDGDIGAGTLGLLAASGISSATDCSAVAVVSEALTAQVKVVADAAGAPAKVSSPAPVQTPSIVSPTTGVLTPQPATASVMDTFNRLGPTEMILAAAAIGGVAYFAFGKKKRRK